MVATSQRRRRSIPSTPRVISPSPTPSERQGGSQDEAAAYHGPVTRSARKRLATPQPMVEEEDSASSLDSEEEHSDEKSQRKGGRGGGERGTGGADGRRKKKSLPGLDKKPGAETAENRSARTRSRSPVATRSKNSEVAAAAAAAAAMTAAALEEKPTGAVTSSSSRKRAATGGASKASLTAEPERMSTSNGHLRPPPLTVNGWSWRDFSRSPSPLGLIPIHRHWRSFVHKHEVPRKLLHVSIGFLVIWLYTSGTQTRAVCPYLMGGLVPIATVDLLRHRYAPFNRLYVRVLGALMRESEFDGYNGVIFYLLGAWIVLYALPKDIGVVSVLLLSWCDTAASTFGRLYGRYTPRIRRGKSLAGSSAAFAVGVATSAWFWGWLATHVGPMPGDDQFMFRGTLGLPAAAAVALGLDAAKTRIGGALALGVMSLWSGFVASASEVVDLFGWDDNLTIPVLSGFGIWAFLKVFG